MKKSLLALGAAAALGGLGFSGAAHAVWAVGAADDAGVTATQLKAADNSGVGHVLVTPYFSTVDGTGTLLSVVNTDTVNGKAVKVRFRGAANSDDILDFTVLLSPQDVWTASVSQGADGKSRLITPDTTCVLPSIPSAANTNGEGVPFLTTRLDSKLSADAQAAHTQEGYVEWLNMADIKKGSAVYNAIKHVNGVAPCTASVLNTLMSASDSIDPATAAGSAWGLSNPTGQLMGNWTIFNGNNVSSYGGPNTAIVAVDSEGVSAAARLFFAPQIGGSDATFPGTVDWTAGSPYAETADPLLTTSTFGGKGNSDDPTLEGAIPLLPFDLPDLSTPYVNNAFTAVDQANDLSASLATTSVLNEWTAGDDNGVKFSTDWVFSQPTRRYHTVINYAAKGTTADPKLIRNTNSVYYYTNGTGGTSKQVELQTHATYGDMVCLTSTAVSYKAYNREEKDVTVSFGGGEWSPGTPVGQTPGFCGEVAVLQFGENRTRALNGQLTANTIKDASLPTGGAGWMSVALPLLNNSLNYGLPVIGYSANTFSASSGSMIGSYGDAITHRYKRPAAAARPVPSGASAL